ncbi:MAG: hypothetical protein K2X87_09070 [Gemmataceae bacterium]|nr:hypothetical protein [Gemmataceae bacterium]
MSPVRLASLTLLAGLGFALAAAAPAAGRQDPKDDKDPVYNKGKYKYSAVPAFKNEGVPAAKLEEAKAVFVSYAQYNVDVVSWPKRYALLADQTATLFPDQTLDALLIDLEKHLLVPVPGNRVGKESADYVREMGKALDDALKDVILKHPDRVVRVNAARMLAVACKSGAWAHYPTVTLLLTQNEVRIGEVAVPIPPEVKYYALQAAGNLLAAHELAAYQIDKGYDNRAHSGEPDAVGAVVQALEKAALDPGSLLGVPPKVGGGPGELPADQKPVAVFFRRQALRALGQCRFAMLPGPAKTTLYPAVTLARFAVSDKTLVLPPRADEVAEAVVGLANMDPPAERSRRDVYTPGIAEAVATGVATYGGENNSNNPDKAVAWKGGAVRMLDGLNRWRARFQPTLLPTILNDPNFDAEKDTRFNAQNVPPIVQATYVQSRDKILTPIAQKSAKVDVEGMRTFVAQETRKGTDKEATITLFDNPKLTVPRK